MGHLKRLFTPQAWPIKRKEETFITKPSPGPHNQTTSLPLSTIMRDMLQYTKTTRETKKALADNQILINGKAVKDHRFPVGVFDTVSLPSMKEAYTLLYKENKKLMLHKLGKEKPERMAKIVNKTVLPKKKIQLNLFDGTNLLVEKDNYKVGDTLILENKKVKKHLKFDKGALVYLIGGKHIGVTGSLEEIKKTATLEKDRIVVKTKKEKVETAKEYAFVIEKPFE